jgi:hypothetical protein
MERRGDYIEILREYEHAVGMLRRDDPLVPRHPAIERFTAQMQTEWQQTLTPVEGARRREAGCQGEACSRYCLRKRLICLLLG